MREPFNLTAQEIAWLVKNDKLELSPTSPLAGLIETSGKRGRKVDRELVADEDRQAAFQILAAPSRLSRITLPAARQTSTFLFYASSQSQSAPLVGLCRQSGSGETGAGDVWEIVPKVTLDDLANLVGLDVDSSGSPADAFSFELSLAGLFALAAAIDTVRAGMAADFLGRRIADNPDYSRGDLDGFFGDGLKHHDPRWLVSMLGLLMPPDIAPEEISIADGYAEMAGMGLLHEKGRELWQASAALRSLVAQFASLLPAFAITTVFADNSGLIDRRSHHALTPCIGKVHHLDMTRLMRDAAARIPIHRLSPGDVKSTFERALLDPERI